MIQNYEAWSPCHRYGLRISAQVLQKTLTFCKNNCEFETGGIMVGYYNRRHDCAIVTDCSGPPRDSTCRRTYFRRGIEGLQRWINRLWYLKERRYYLGEWHFHQFAKPNPSSTDICQIISNAENRSYKSPEVIMFIIGGDPKTKWSCRSFVYSRQVGLIELVKGWEHNSFKN